MRDSRGTRELLDVRLRRARRRLPSRRHTRQEPARVVDALQPHVQAHERLDVYLEKILPAGCSTRCAARCPPVQLVPICLDDSSLSNKYHVTENDDIRFIQGTN